MKKAVTIILVAVISFLLGLFVSNIYSSITGRATQPIEKFTYTRAICNEEGKCLNLLIECENGDVVSATPVSDLVDFSVELEEFNPENPYSVRIEDDLSYLDREGFC